jgi:hypothetical protein
MKTKLTIPAGIARMAMSAALLLVGYPGAVSQAAPASPVGSWDYVISGSRQGLAVITFNNDFTFDGYEIVVPKSQATTSTNPRGGPADANRTGTPNTNSASGLSNIFGGGAISGPWGYDSKGRVIGFFTEVATGTCTTNLQITITTNGATTIYSTNIVAICTGVTNGVSFTGTLTPGKRLNLKCSGTLGNSTYQGVPVSGTLSNLTGSWYGIKSASGQPSFYEFLTLGAGGAPNRYVVVGTGPGYGYTDGSAFAMLSAQKQIAFVLPQDNGNLRAVVGSFNPKSMSGKTSGWDQDGNTSFTNRVSFQVQFMPGP